jgi:hypothetical protein
MPPQQVDGLLDLIGGALDFGTHDNLLDGNWLLDGTRLI